jgi:hypothetical protein
MNDLVKRLSERKSAIILGGRDPSVARLKSRIEEFGHVFVEFTEAADGPSRSRSSMSSHALSCTGLRAGRWLRVRRPAGTILL